MAIPILSFLDSTDISWAFYKHLEGRFENAKAASIVTDTAAKMDEKIAPYITAFTEICDLHGVDPKVAVGLFSLRAQGKPFKGDDLALWKKISHPAFLDFPEDLPRWVANVKVQFAVRDDTKEPIIVRDHVIGYYVNSLPQPKLRRIIHKLELNSNALSEGDHRTYVSVLGDILVAADSSGFEHVTLPSEEVIPGVTPGIPENAIDILEALERSPSLFALDKKGERSKADILKEVVLENSRVTGETVDTLRRIDPKHIADALKISRALSNHATSRGISAVPASPTDVFEHLHSTKSTMQRDPILYAWSQKILQEADGKRYQSLADAWANASASRHKPKHDARILNVLKAIDAGIAAGKPAVYSLHDFKRESDKTDAMVQAIGNLLLTESKEWNAKRDGKGGRAYIASEALQRLAQRLHASPAQLIVQPTFETPKPDIKDNAKPQPTPSITAPAAPTIPMHQGLSKHDLLDKAARLILGERANGDDTTRIKAILNTAYTTPTHAIEHGLPSLPHMWLLLAADESSRSLPAKDLFHKFSVAWGQDPSRLDVTGSVKMSFAIAAIATMRDKGELYSDYQRYMEAATRALPARQRSSVPKFEKMLRLDNPEWNQSDRDAAPEALAWLDSHGIRGENFLGATPSARKYVGRLRHFVQQAATAKR